MRVLVATDGSADAAEAIEWLAHFPLPADAGVESVGAVPSPLFDVGYALVAWRALWERSAAVVEEARGRLAKRWPHAAGRVLEGDAREAIIQAATTSKADLIVLGARGLGAVLTALLGSVSVGVTRHAPCSVLVCKGAARPVRAMTIALDGSPDSQAALDYLTRLPISPDAVVSLVGVVEPLQYPAATPEMLVTPSIEMAIRDHEDERRRQLAAVLGAAADQLRPLVARVRITTPVGRAADCILRQAKQDASDLVVVGARGVGAFERLLLGSVSETVLRGAECPVLVVRRSP